MYTGGNKSVSSVDVIYVVQNVRSLAKYVLENTLLEIKQFNLKFRADHLY